MANIRAFQAWDEGSIPSARTILKSQTFEDFLRNEATKLLNIKPFCTVIFVTALDIL